MSIEVGSNRCGGGSTIRRPFSIAQPRSRSERYIVALFDLRPANARGRHANHFSIRQCDRNVRLAVADIESVDEAVNLLIARGLVWPKGPPGTHRAVLYRSRSNVLLAARRRHTDDALA